MIDDDAYQVYLWWLHGYWWHYYFDVADMTDYELLWKA